MLNATPSNFGGFVIKWSMIVLQPMSLLLGRE